MKRAAIGARLRRVTRDRWIDDQLGWVCRLTTGSGLYSWPRWSPDGKRIVLVHELNRRSAIYVMNADAKRPRRVTGGAIDDAYPDWQPLK